MDLQLHYSKIRQEEAKMTDEFPVIVSHESSDGGKAGVFAEVTRRIAARFIALGLARIATQEEKKFFADAREEARAIAIDALERATLTATAFSLKGIERIQSGVKTKE